MKNITISMDDELYRLARIKAAEQSTSISALCKAFIIRLTGSGANGPPMRFVSTRSSSPAAQSDSTRPSRSFAFERAPEVITRSARAASSGSGKATKWRRFLLLRKIRPIALRRRPEES